MRSPFLLSLVLVACGGDPTDQGPTHSTDDAYEGDTDTDADADADTDYDVDVDTGIPRETGEAGESDDEVLEENDWIFVANDPTSTFSSDVDTGSYTMARAALNRGVLPTPSTIRPEEFLNYFRYATRGPVLTISNTPPPTNSPPFTVEMEVGPSWFGPTAETKLMKIAVKAAEVPPEERDPVNLVFLIDVSGSMQSPEKLDLVKYTLGELVDKLAPTDTLGIVVYAGAAGLVLPPTPVVDKSIILQALDNLTAGGGTNGQAGIQQAYSVAASAFRTDGVNRVVMCSDGDLNVGLTGQALVNELATNRDQGIYLTTLKFGQSAGGDAQMEQLANNADGNYAYIDSPNEALRMVEEKLVSTLQVVAKDTKLQVTFDPDVVEQYRLIGYENRLLNDDDFANDSVDAGDLGAGHQMMALYELQLAAGAEQATAPLADLRMRYKEPDASVSTEHHWTLNHSELRTVNTVSQDFKLTAAVAEFSELLRDSIHVDNASYQQVATLATEARPQPSSIESELVDLINEASQLSGTP